MYFRLLFYFINVFWLNLLFASQTSSYGIFELSNGQFEHASSLRNNFLVVEVQEKTNEFTPSSSATRNLSARNSQTFSQINPKENAIADYPNLALLKIDGKPIFDKYFDDFANNKFLNLTAIFDLINNLAYRADLALIMSQFRDFARQEISNIDDDEVVKFGLNNKMSMLLARYRGLMQERELNNDRDNNNDVIIRRSWRREIFAALAVSGLIGIIIGVYYSIKSNNSQNNQN